MSTKRSHANSRAVAFLRISVGVLFLIFAQYKVFGSTFTHGGGFEMWIHRFLQDGSAYPFMVPVLQDVVLPHATVIATFVAYSELALGLSLVLGIFVRAASIGGVVYMLTLLFSANYPGHDAPLWEYFGASLEHLVFALCFVAFMLGNPSDMWSLQAAVRRRRRY